jgi:hypothetical protein
MKYLGIHFISFYDIEGNTAEKPFQRIEKNDSLGKSKMLAENVELRREKKQLSKTFWQILLETCFTYHRTC